MTSTRPARTMSMPARTAVSAQASSGSGVDVTSRHTRRSDRFKTFSALRGGGVGPLSCGNRGTAVAAWRLPGTRVLTTCTPEGISLHNFSSTGTPGRYDSGAIVSTETRQPSESRWRANRSSRCVPACRLGGNVVVTRRMPRPSPGRSGSVCRSATAPTMAGRCPSRSSRAATSPGVQARAGRDDPRHPARSAGRAHAAATRNPAATVRPGSPADSIRR